MDPENTTPDHPQGKSLVEDEMDIGELVELLWMARIPECGMGHYLNVWSYTGQTPHFSNIGHETSSPRDISTHAVSLDGVEHPLCSSAQSRTGEEIPARPRTLADSMPPSGGSPGLLALDRIL